jgi:integrase
MASIDKYKVDGYVCYRLTDTFTGIRLQYSIKLDKYSEKQWLSAHESVISCLSPEEKQNLTNKAIKSMVLAWLASSKEAKANAKQVGIKIKEIEAKTELSIKHVTEKYLAEYCKPGINSQTAKENAERQCRKLLMFFKEINKDNYNALKRESLADYPEWRIKNSKHGKVSAYMVNKELGRLASIIKHGVMYYDWKERYLLNGIRVKETQDNTKSVRPFEIAEIKTILGWLRANADLTGNWYMHDMVLLSVCSGLEAKALTNLKKDWFKRDVNLLRVYDKLISGVLDAKTQNRAREIPLTPTMIKLYEREFIFNRPGTARYPNSTTPIKDYSERTFGRCEKETGIKDVNWHRFRHTYATARLSSGWQLVRVSKMLGHSNINTTAVHYAEYDLSSSPEGFEGMIETYSDFMRWLDEDYFTAS